MEVRALECGGSKATITAASNPRLGQSSSLAASWSILPPLLPGMPSAYGVLRVGEAGSVQGLMAVADLRAASIRGITAIRRRRQHGCSQSASRPPAMN